MRPLGPGHAQDPSAREGSHLGLFEEMDGIEWTVSPVVLVHERCACACPNDVDGKVGRGIPIQGLEMSRIPSRRKGERPLGVGCRVVVWRASSSLGSCFW